ncbi:MAG: hypothetical protein RLN82_03305 [Pseudomonadales bacterium]
MSISIQRILFASAILDSYRLLRLSIQFLAIFSNLQEIVSLFIGAREIGVKPYETIVQRPKRGLLKFQLLAGLAKFARLLFLSLLLQLLPMAEPGEAESRHNNQ